MLLSPACASSSACFVPLGAAARHSDGRTDGRHAATPKVRATTTHRNTGSVQAACKCRKQHALPVALVLGVLPCLYREPGMRARVAAGCAAVRLSVPAGAEAANVVRTHAIAYSCC